MMRGPKKSTMAVRNTEGEMILEDVEVRDAKRPAFCRWPVIRGVLGYIDTMKLGYKCLMRSAEIAGLEDVVEEKPQKKAKSAESEPTQDTKEGTVATSAQEKKEEEEKLPAWVMTLIMVIGIVLGLGLGIGLFLFLPSFIYTLISSNVAFLALNFANSVLPVARVTSFCNLTTVISLFAGVIFLKEPFGWISLLASIVIIVGVWGVQRKAR